MTLEAGQRRLDHRGMPERAVSFARGLAAVAVVAVAPETAVSWDHVGHEITAHIAWQRMTGPARQRAAELLDHAPDDSGLALPAHGEARSRGERRRLLFVFASTWPDVVRDRRLPERRQAYHRGDWHWQDVFWERRDGRPVSIDRPRSGRALSKLADFERALRDPEATDADKALALAWFLHVAGDVHNPLHTASRVTEDEPRGDAGGNRFVLRQADDGGEGEVNLHGYWDTIVRRVRSRLPEESLEAYVDAWVRELLRRHRFAASATGLPRATTPHGMPRVGSFASSSCTPSRCVGGGCRPTRTAIARSTSPASVWCWPAIGSAKR